MWWFERERPNLNEECLNAWSPDGGPVGEGLGGMALLEEVCHWREVLGFQKPKPTPVIPFCHMMRIKT